MRHLSLLLSMLFFGLFGCHLLGCLAASELNDGDPIPLPGDSLAIIPLSARNSLLPIELLGEYGFRHLDFDSRGQGKVLEAGYHLHIEKKAEDIYGWSFNEESKGILLKRKNPLSTDSGGIFIVGSFSGDSLTYGPEELWLPQILTPSRPTWEAYGRRMTLISVDTALWLPGDGPNQHRTQDPITGRLRVEASVIREESNGLTTFYAFSEGIGLLAYEQKVGDESVGSGLLELGLALYGKPAQLWP